ncbi:histidinol-phosphate aminotransferase [Clostridia bacterium]|nr:histidinol-phosphate aminotransferase [Clostridia bacterium]
MSRFLNKRTEELTPYVPGEQTHRKVLKLNTNESPYPPSPEVGKVLDFYKSVYKDLRLYPDPEAFALRDVISDVNRTDVSRVFVGGGSDEILGYAFMAFCESDAYFPDITYGFYRVFANLAGVASREIPLKEDFTINPDDYNGVRGPIIIANPNAPTGIVLPQKSIETLLSADKNRLVIVDEAYIDFSPQNTCLPLLAKYDNLLIVRTCSKSYGLAGMRIGYAFGSPELISDLNRVKYSFNPYNLDRVSITVGIAAFRDQTYLRETVSKITKTREYTAQALSDLGFEVLPSAANFVFARRENTDAKRLYEQLREQGVLIRYFANVPRITDFLRISIGKDTDMKRFITVLKGLLS